MSRRNAVWKALFVVTTLVVRLHAQSPFESSSWLTKTEVITQTGYSFARGTPEIGSDPGAVAADHRSEEAKSPSAAIVRPKNQSELDRGVYYRNKLEFAFDAGWLPMNIPFVFDISLGDAYNKTPLNYTLVPLVASLRWHINDVGGPWIFRGNWDMTFSGSVTVITRGPETRYFSYDMGIRRNFVPR